MASSGRAARESLPNAKGALPSLIARFPASRAELQALSDENVDEMFEHARALFGGTDEEFDKFCQLAQKYQEEIGEEQTEESMMRNVVFRRAILTEMKVKEKAMSDEIDDLETQIRELEKKKQEVSTARKDFQDIHLANAEEAYCQSSCLLLATRMHARLPRELRDMVYAQIWTPDYVFAQCITIMDALQGFQIIDPPHVLDDAFVGEDVGSEILEAFYGVDPVPIQPFEALDPFQVEHLVKHDPFLLGVQPANVLRRMNILLNMDELTFGDARGNFDMNDIQESMHSLLEVKKKKGFKLNIKLMQRRIRLNDWPKWFDVLKPILDAFEKEGAHVKIMWSYNGSDWAEHKVRMVLTERVRQHPSPDGWKTEIIERLDEEHRIRDRHCEYLFEDHDDYNEEEFCTDGEEDDASMGSGEMSLIDRDVHDDASTGEFDV